MPLPPPGATSRICRPGPPGLTRTLVTVSNVSLGSIPASSRHRRPSFFPVPRTTFRLCDKGWEPPTHPTPCKIYYSLLISPCSNARGNLFAEFRALGAPVPTVAIKLPLHSPSYASTLHAASISISLANFCRFAFAGTGGGGARTSRAHSNQSRTRTMTSSSFLVLPRRSRGALLSLSTPCASGRVESCVTSGVLGVLPDEGHCAVCSSVAFGGRSSRSCLRHTRARRTRVSYLSTSVDGGLRLGLGRAQSAAQLSSSSVERYRHTSKPK
ncbi:hypothetical protein OH76DRAFT_802397 [Lentinus brumalis]|uniref:Uncharacterized protein n=1 Tax=Lentinus brumalis TaxID=2498619 RepID=A0A371D387_9APHY|nr:hypothetical protein OH76DRAFT_802397 [Polyporus brumalis]